MSPATDGTIKPQKVDLTDVPSLRAEIISGDLSRVKPVFSRDSKYLYCGSGKEILKYSLSAERLVKALCGHEDAVTDLCLNSDGDLVSCSLDGTIRIWKDDVSSKVHQLTKPIRFMDTDKTGNVWFVVLQDEGATAAYPKGTLCEFDISTGKVYAHVYAGCIHAMQVSPSGRFAAAIVGGHAGRLLVNCRNEKVTREWRQLQRGSARLTALAFHPSDEHIATGDQNGRIRRWYVFSGEDNRSLAGSGEREAVKSEQHWHCTPVKGLAFAGASDVLISVAGEAVLCQWTSPSQRHPGVLPRIARSGAAQMAVGPAKQGLVAVIGKANSVSIVDVNNNQLKCTLYGMATTEAAATVEEGSRKAAGGTMLSSSSGCQLTALEDNAVLVSSPAFTDVQIFDAAELRLADEIVPLVARNFVTTAWQTGSKTGAIPPVPWVVSASSGSNDGSWLVGALHRPSAIDGEGDETLLKFWDRKGNRLHTVCVSPHKDRITALLPITRKLPETAADGSESEQLFASYSRDGTVSIWGLVAPDEASENSNRRWHLRASLGWRGHTVPQAMTCDEDGSVLVAAFGNYVTIWSLDSYTELTAGRIHMSMPVKGVHMYGTRLYCLTASKGVSLLTSVDLLTLKTDKTVTFHGKASSLSAQIGKEKMFITCPRKVLCFSAPALKLVSSVPLSASAVSSCVLSTGLVIVWDQSGKVLKLDPDSPVEGVNEINTSMPPVEEAGVEEDSKMIVEEEEEEEQEGVEDLIDAVDQWSLADDKMLKNVNVLSALNSLVEPTAPSHVCPMPSKLLPDLLDRIFDVSRSTAADGAYRRNFTSS
ncbi:WD protein, putative [Perkinsus marinus ATCC 50983]|uniref:WD protein, putative n=1 Tax=Perkinsus marinus (strain ATCC 50983 / TXsc) TaxID=423536 RepID=C5M078_PERM5|nr:WD protein, putative [Perkinsus marinus ATCC 50983]EEQ97656.1 WD protein, putative [Perkinsus marinus ATCC 50983]|eukprot:XP_002764939.1 WD protein, putative [Perkinsus marinus ATCC 50983]